MKNVKSIVDKLINEDSFTPHRYAEELVKSITNSLHKSSRDNSLSVEDTKKLLKSVQYGVADISIADIAVDYSG